MLGASLKSFKISCIPNSPLPKANEIMGERNYYNESKSTQADDPPNSRLFIVGNKRLNENDFRTAFDRFGEIEDIWVVKDRRTGESKGVTYIKYTKTSDAANALEAMNGKTLAGTDRHIKVMIASSRNKGSLREENEDEKIQRLFIVTPKSMAEAELENYFKQFGDIDYVNIVRDKETRESKGFAYIKYYKFSHAAKAFEECDRKYKAVFSEPRKPNMARHAADLPGGLERGSNSSSSLEGIFSNDKCYRLMVIGSPHLTEDQLWKLFNIVPGLEYAQLRTEARRSLGSVVYASLKWATYAVEKLHGFEYPTGSRLIVKPDGTVPKLDSPRPTGNNRNVATDTSNPNLIQLAETIAHATNIIQNAGISGTKLNTFELSDHSKEICSVRLPNPQPLASIDAETLARCFIVCSPPPPPQSILRDVFCRFGNLIEVYLLANRNCGYVKYATKESALEAIKILHGADVCGGRIKVIKAEERNDHSRKRQRTDDQ